MLHRYTYLELARVLADSGVIVTDILTSDPITAITVRFSAINGATSNKANLPVDCISKLEVIDGGEVLWSLTGREACALCAYEQRFMPYSLLDEVAGDEQTAVFNIQFGRWIGDPDYAFDPSKFRNPQIRLTWNLSAIRTVAATAFVTGSGRVDYLAECLSGGPAPKGFIRSTEEYAFTTAASGVTRVDLPTDMPLRAIMVRSWLTAHYVSEPINNVKLTCDQGKFVPVDESTIHLIEQWSLYHPEFHIKHNYWCANADTLYSIFKQDEVIAGTPCGGADTTFQYGNVGCGEGVADVRVAGSISSSLHQIQALTSGWAPFGCVWIPLGDYADPEDWFPAPSFGSVRLELTNGLANGAGAVVLQQARAY